jgi:hypothetical protein
MKNLVKTFESFDHNSELGNLEVDHESNHELDHYMFFGNLETIKRYVDALLEMDPVTVNEILHNGHDWAADHIATSKDDIEEVANFLMNEMQKSTASEDEMFEGDEYDSEKYSCNECGMTYEGSVYEDGEPQSMCECGGTITRM